jgi:hypothetical protein
VRTSKVGAWIAIATAAAFAACGDDDDTTVNGGGPPRPAELTAAWQGEWDLAFVLTECGSGDTLLAAGDTPVLCEGDDITAPFAPWEVSCEGTVTDTRIDVDCDTLLTEGPCQIRTEINWTITRTGDTLAGTATVMIIGTGPGDCDSTICADLVMSGTRIGDDGGLCAVTTALQPWRISEKLAGVIRRPSWTSP